MAGAIIVNTVQHKLLRVIKNTERPKECGIG